jgi:hypothetical protein
MEEDLNKDDGEESKEYFFSSKNPLTKYCFVFMEYIRTINPELYEKATEYASDNVGITITDFDIEDLSDEEFDELQNDLDDVFEEIDDDEEYNDGYDDEQE